MRLITIDEMTRNECGILVQNCNVKYFINSSMIECDGVLEKGTMIIRIPNYDITSDLMRIFTLPVNESSEYYISYQESVLV